MFILEDNDLVKRAAERCRKNKPKIKVKRFGSYYVSSSTEGEWYDVYCTRSPNGDKVVSCSCPTRDGLVCYHGVAAATFHIAMAKQQQGDK